GPRHSIHLKRNRLRVLCVVKGIERKPSWLNLAFGDLRKRRRQPGVIKCGARRVPFGINEDKFRRLRARSAIPEAILLCDPVWNNIRDVNTMPQVPRKKLLRALVVLTSPLRLN